MRLIDNSFYTHNVNRNTKVLQIPLTQKKLLCAKAYGLVRSNIFEFMSNSRTLLRDTNFHIVFLQKKDYLNLFDVVREEFGSNSAQNYYFDGRGFLCYSEVVKLEDFFYVLAKLAEVTKSQFLLISYYGLFIDKKRHVFLSAVTSATEFYSGVTVCVKNSLIFAFNFLVYTMNLIALYIYNLSFFFNFFFFFRRA